MYTVGSTVLFASLYNPHGAVASCMYILPELCPQGKRTGAPTGAAWKGTEDCARGAFSRLNLSSSIRMPSRAKATARRLRYSQLREYAAQRSIPSSSTINTSLFVASLFRFLSNCRITEEDFSDLSTCFDNYGRSDITVMYVSLLFKHRQDNYVVITVT